MHYSTIEEIRKSPWGIVAHRRKEIECGGRKRMSPQEGITAIGLKRHGEDWKNRARRRYRLELVDVQPHPEGRDRYGEELRSRDWQATEKRRETDKEYGYLMNPADLWATSIRSTTSAAWRAKQARASARLASKHGLAQAK